MTNQEIRKNIMTRVYMVYLLRKARQPLMLEVAIVVLAIVFSTLFVSFGNVMANAPALYNPAELSQFFANAFLHTDAVVKILCVAGLIAALLLAKDITRGVTRFAYQKFT